MGGMTRHEHPAPRVEHRDCTNARERSRSSLQVSALVRGEGERWLQSCQPTAERTAAMVSAESGDGDQRQRPVWAFAPTGGRHLQALAHESGSGSS